MSDLASPLEATDQPTKNRVFSVTAIVLTKNEELHIARCLDSLSSFVQRVCVVDSGSNDRTVEIARQRGAEVYNHAWVNYSEQFQWSLDNCHVETEWTMRIDADEYLSPELRETLSSMFANDGPDADGIVLRRCMIFMGQPIRHGFFYPQRMLRLWRTGMGAIEQRWMDEHIVLKSDRISEAAYGDLYDENLKDVSWWVSKLDGYATREMFDILVREREALENANISHSRPILRGRARTKRWIKEHIYSRLPLAAKSALYFFYRYFIGLGFLDGRRGFFFHFIQAWFYRLLVDVKTLEVQRAAAERGTTVFEEISRRHGIDL